MPTIFDRQRRKLEDRQTWAIFLALSRSSSLAQRFLELIDVPVRSTDIRLRTWPRGYGRIEPDGEITVGRDVRIIYEAKRPGCGLTAEQLEQYLAARPRRRSERLFVLAHTSWQEPDPSWEAACRRHSAHLRTLSHDRFHAFLADPTTPGDDPVAKFLTRELSAFLSTLHTRDAPMTITPEQLSAYRSHATDVHAVDTLLRERLSRLKVALANGDTDPDEPYQRYGRWLLAEEAPFSSGVIAGVSLSVPDAADAAALAWWILPDPDWCPRVEGLPRERMEGAPPEPEGWTYWDSPEGPVFYRPDSSVTLDDLVQPRRFDALLPRLVEGFEATCRIGEKIWPVWLQVALDEALPTGLPRRLRQRVLEWTAAEAGVTSAWLEEGVLKVENRDGPASVVQLRFGPASSQLAGASLTLRAKPDVDSGTVRSGGWSSPNGHNWRVVGIDRKRELDAALEGIRPAG